MNEFLQPFENQIYVTMVKYILSVDGGGIRGIIPATILTEIEERTGKPISEIFHLMAGTSSGGIAVAALSKKNSEGKPQYAASQLIELYQEHGSQIFYSSFFRKSVWSWYNCTQYPHESFEKLLDKYFNEATLADVTTNLLLTSYDIQNSCPFFFKSWKEPTNTIKLKHAVRATTAAPTYFEPKYLKVNETERVLVDGAVFANNPAACAYASAKVLFPNDDIVVLSIGTGRTQRSINHNDSKSLGKVGWISPILHMMFASSLEVVNYQLDQIIGDRYIRIQSTLKMAKDELDNVDIENIKILQEEANLMIEENHQQIEKFCDLICGC